MRLKSMCWLVVLAVLECCWRTTSSSTPKETVVAEVESSLLNLFGFKGRPKVDRSKVVIPKAMLDIYEKQMGYRLNTAAIPKRGLYTKSANTIRSFTHIESSIDSRFPKHHKFRLKFDVSSVPSGEQLKAAELTLNREIIDWLAVEGYESEHYQRILVNDILKPGVKGKRAPILRVVDSKLIDTRKNSTLSLDVLPAVERWFENPSSNHGLLISIYGNGKNKTSPARHVRIRRDASEDETTWSSIQPLLFTYTDDGKHKQKTKEEMSLLRPRRAARKHRKNEKRQPCRRHSMYVDFAEVGWSDWIVAPPGYDAYYCQGECNFPLAEHLNTTNHAIVQTLMNSVSPGKVPKTCCVPTQLNAISMLYLDDNNKVVLKNYNEMVVIGCGCR